MNYCPKASADVRWWTSIFNCCRFLFMCVIIYIHNVHPNEYIYRYALGWNDYANVYMNKFFRRVLLEWREWFVHIDWLPTCLFFACQLISELLNWELIEQPTLKRRHSQVPISSILAKSHALCVYNANSIVLSESALFWKNFFKKRKKL